MALHRELQTELLPFQFPGQMELRQDVIHQAPTARFFLAHLGRDYMVVAAGREPTETCGQTIWGSRLWCPALCKPRAAHNSLLRRALLNLQPAVETPVLAAHGWPQLIPSADPAWGAVRKAAYGGGARVSLELGPGSSPGCLHVAGWQEQSKQQ